MARYVLGVGVYDLIGVVKHWGQLNNGHYKAVAKNHGVWFEYDDETIREIATEEVVDAHAYVLFYQKRSEIGQTRTPVPFEQFEIPQRAEVIRIDDSS